VAASAWTVFPRAIKAIGAGSISLSAAEFRLSLHKTSASAALLTDISVASQVGFEISATGGYAAGGKSLASPLWTVGTSAGAYKWDATDLVFTASGASLNNVRYAVIKTSVTPASGLLVAFCALSTAAFTVNNGNTATVQINSLGIFEVS
jgi:hypothetical protein